MSADKGMNWDKIRDRLLQRRKASKDADARWWKPEQGRHKMRILPAWEGHDTFYLEFGMHYNIAEGEAPIECPKITKDLPCPICEFVRGLWRTGEEGDKELAKKVRAARRFASNIVMLDQPSQVRIWSYGPMVWDQLAELCVGDEGVVPIADADKGVDLTLIVTSRSTGDNVFPQYQVKPSFKATALEDKGVLDNLNDLTDMIVGRVKGYDEIRSILLGTGMSTEEEPKKGEVIVDDQEGDADGSEAIIKKARAAAQGSD